MGKFKYLPLAGANYIRILHIPKGEGECIDCTILNFDLSLELSYEALSYTWGNGDKTKQIRIIANSFG
jgi:hypothetical protein